MSIQSCRCLLELVTEVWSGRAPIQVFYMDEHVDIGPPLTVWSWLRPQAKAIMGAWWRKQDTSKC